MNSQSSIFKSSYSRPLVLEHRPIIFGDTESPEGQPPLLSFKPESDSRVAIEGRLHDLHVHKNHSNRLGGS